MGLGKFLVFLCGRCLEDYVELTCVIRVDRIASFIGSNLDALRHNVPDFGTRRSNPLLIWPFWQDLALVALWKVLRIITPILPCACTEIAHHSLALGFEGCDYRSFIFKQINVPHRRIGGLDRVFCHVWFRTEYDLKLLPSDEHLLGMRRTGKKPHPQEPTQHVEDGIGHAKRLERAKGKAKIPWRNVKVKIRNRRAAATRMVSDVFEKNHSPA